MSEQGQAPPPREPETPKQNEPRAGEPAPDQVTTPLPADASATPGQQHPTAEHPVTPGPQSTPEQPAQSTPEQPAAEAPAAPAAAAPIPPVAAPAGPGRVRRFAGHRATQLVAVGLLGLVLGGGVVGAIAANRFDERGPGHVRVYERGDHGPDRGPGRGGDRFDERGPFSDRGDRFER